MPRLASVVIRRFKRLEEIELPISDVTLLIGANNAGKSSVLQAIHFAVAIAQSARLIGEGVAWQKDAFELSFNPAQLLYSPISDVLSLATGGTLQEPRPSQIEIELRDEDGGRCTVGLRRGRNRNIAVSIVGRQIGERLMDLTQPFTVYAPGLAGIPKEERFLSPGVVRRIVARGDANLALRNVLRMLREDEARWDAFVQDMQSIFGAITIEIDFDVNTDESIEVYFQFPGGPRLQVDAAGTSVLQASQILAYISLFQPQVLILDEPDSHLHPDNQRALCDLVFRLAAERGFQALISTHSRHVLDSLKDRGRVIWLSKGRSVEQPDLNSTAVLMDLGALDSVDYFADGHTRCVVATEDSDKDALRALLWSNDFVEADTEVASYAGCAKVDAALVLGDFLSDKAPHVRLVVHRDRDYMSDGRAQDFETKLENAGVSAFLTAHSDIEGHFLNADHLHHLNPEVPLARIQELIQTAIQETRERSLEAIVNLRTEEAFRNRNNGGGAPNHGAIAVQAEHDLRENEARFCRGKVVLGRLMALLQQELGGNPRIYFPSQFLRFDGLSGIARSIW
ncbi:AAA family ATPase [Ralstonia sp. UBA689]|uniref:AAA family ATPase n=1 Tax=Ralstonia sp. UBA689 TaxID=1947373 RepID=UPI0025EAFE63|nr:ATP-binding protein [Ralstonia sp. UBA689]